MAMSDVDVAHLLRRSGFDASPAEVAALTGQELTTVVDRVLDTTANPPETRPPELDLPVDQTTNRLNGLRRAWHDRMATTPTPIVEKMTLFWHGHFTVEANDVNRPNALYEMIAYYRANALGNLRTFSHGMALLPAMLMYLDNDRNRKQSPNQNFARELLELFLLGIGNYTEADVIAAAAAWTGHSLVNDSANDFAQYQFKPNDHDTGNKTFFGITKNWDGPQIIDELFDNPTSRPVLARFIAGKLWSFFAKPNPPSNVVDDLANVFIAANFEIKPLLRALFLRPEFYAADVRTGLVRTPVEYVASLMRATNKTATYVKTDQWMGQLGQQLFSPPNVAGWKPNAYWISAAAAGYRAKFADALATQLVKDAWLADSATKTPTEAVAAALAAFHVTHPSAGLRTLLVDWVTQRRAAGRAAAEPRYLSLLVMLSPEIQLA
jgi:uncharacterized protein (DUF1800 family)